MSLIRLMTYLKNSEEFSADVIAGMSNKELNTNFRSEVFEGVRESVDYTSFKKVFFGRNPYHRIISCYIDKYVNPDSATPNDVPNTDTYSDFVALLNSTGLTKEAMKSKVDFGHFCSVQNDIGWNFYQRLDCPKFDLVSMLPSTGLPEGDLTHKPQNIKKVLALIGKDKHYRNIKQFYEGHSGAHDVWQENIKQQKYSNQLDDKSLCAFSREKLWQVMLPEKLREVSYASFYPPEVKAIFDKCYQEEFTFYQALGFKFTPTNTLDEVVDMKEAVSKELASEKVVSDVTDTAVAPAQKSLDDGLKLVRDSEFTQAVEVLKPLIEDKPMQPKEVMQSYGQALLASGDLDSARSVFNKLKHQYPHLPIGYLGLARLARIEKDWSLNIELIDACLTKFPNRKQAVWYVHRADGRLEQGDLKQAFQDYELCTKQYPENVAAYIGLAKVAEARKDWREALRWWDFCFERFPLKAKPWWYGHKKQVEQALKSSLHQKKQKKATNKKTTNKKTGEWFKKPYRPSKYGINFKHVLIITYGRSGSTLLQGVLNTIDGVVIRGENDNVFFDFYQSYGKLMKCKQAHKNAVLPSQAWYGVGFYEEEILIEYFGNLARDILIAGQHNDSENITLGFKEIRYGDVGEQLPFYLDFLAQIFPNCAFIFNTRNLQQVSQSGWWKDAPQEDVLAGLRELESQFNQYAKAHPKMCFTIDYDDVVNKSDRLKSMYEFLGATYNEKLVNQVLDIPHSYEPEQERIKNL